MKLRDILSDDWRHGRARAVILEAPPGLQRRRLLRKLAAEAQGMGARSWVMDCDFTTGGPWAGIDEVFRELLPELEATQPELAQKHDYELAMVVPEIQRRIRVRNPSLTDLSTDDEKVRNFPADRAYRIVHGLIDLLAGACSGETRTLFCCDNFDGVSFIGRRFFKELIRRRGDRLGLALVLAAPPGGAAAILDILGSERVAKVVRIDLPGEEEESPDQREILAHSALELDDFAGEDVLRRRSCAPRILHHARRGNREDLLFKWNCLALEMFNTLGFYEDARVYGEYARSVLKGRTGPGIETSRFAVFLKLIMCHLGLRDTEAAMRIAEEDAIGKVHRPEWYSQVCYLLAMLHARYLPTRDLDLAEAYLEDGIRALEGAGAWDERLHFQYAFNRNGLAMVRHFQGRYEDALALCRACQERLDAHLAQDRHRLHRSVLFYNQAQVYVALGAREQAIELYSAAMAMDPNYSEYYNERGSVFLKANRLEEALADYHKAIELSPPYFESYTNLGQCLRKLGRPREAVEAYSTALDLAPDQFLALVGRAQALEDLEALEEAITDYTAALTLDPGQWEVLANRAVLQYHLGRLPPALTDLEQAIELAPSEPRLYQNRAIALEALGRHRDAMQDLHTYLRLEPKAGDRSEVLADIARLSEHASQTAGLTGSGEFARPDQSLISQLQE